MTSARWEQAKQAFHRAYELPAPQRSQFLATLDDELRSDVESLLRHDPKNFLEKSATQYAVELLKTEPVPERLGAYRIVKELGRGGMATVYLAERADGQFEKRAAIKILHAGITAGDLRSRFLQERQLLANLDHPNIVRLLDGNVTPDGRPYLVEDYVEGTPITSYAATHHLSRRDRLQLFQQVVSAIDYAHHLGIVHGDLKPANILVNADGNARLIDFGIARIGEGQTTEAFRYWTPEYSSPEQAAGAPVGPPSDIYSLGAVLFELVTGARRDTASGWCGLRGPLRKVIEQCMARDPAKRPSASQLRASVQHIAGDGGRWIAVSATTVLLVVLSALAVRRTPPSALPSHLRSIPIAAEASFEYEPVLSPDGKDVVYAWNEGDTSRGINLYRKPVAGGDPERLTFADRRDAFPQYSPDGRHLLYSRSSRTGVAVALLDLATRRESVIHRVDSEQEGRIRSVRWAVWMADGRHIALVQRLHPSGPHALFLAGVDGRVLRQLTFPPAGSNGDQQASASPDGRYLAFVRFTTGATSEIHLLPLNGGEPRQITHHATQHAGLSWSPDSRHLYFGGRIRSARFSIHRIPVDEDGVAEHIPGIDGNASWPSVAVAAGKLRLVYVREEETVNVRFSRQGQPVAGLCPSTLFDGLGISLSPDGRQAAFSSTRSGEARIWTCDIHSGKAAPAASADQTRAENPRWSPDGSRIAYTVTQGDSTDIGIHVPAGGDFRHVRLEGSQEGRPSWSRNGRFLYFRSDRDGSRRIWKMPADADPSSAVAVTGPDAHEALESPDGQWLYYAKDRAHPGLFRVPVSGGTEQKVADGVREGWWDIATTGPYWIRNQDGRHFVVHQPWAASTPTRVFALPEEGGVWAGFAVSPDGNTFYWSQSTRHSIDIMMLDGL